MSRPLILLAAVMLCGSVNAEEDLTLPSDFSPGMAGSITMRWLPGIARLDAPRVAAYASSNQNSQGVNATHQGGALDQRRQHPVGNLLKVEF